MIASLGSKEATWKGEAVGGMPTGHTARPGFMSHRLILGRTMYVRPVPIRGRPVWEVIGEYIQALKDLSTKILDKLTEGLGLPKGYLTETDLNKDDVLTINHYPPCPKPSLTIGLPTHTDPTLINLVHATPLDVPGLQLFKDGLWFDLETTPDSLFVFIGNQLEVISNAKLKAPPHRAVTNAEKPRTTSVYFVNPAMDCVVEPAKVLLEADNDRPLYKSFKYGEYFKAHTGAIGDRHDILEKGNFTIKY
ncbi:hypothetical protein RND81_12G103300 [Saponaria officinalis]|uniref:Fe2OG dioxygenase domain-containing protein n=1 Tax=Saponaria officinalis TaxID=3572 RepID=A0AAW1H8W8_SAPOF